ncbi:ABC transporter ATP-binding protein [Sandaracinus amylolyticus]|uniref:ABC transporter ATP-binding protein n=1 Tax=Sandaracinus amylolyticus TaxID=927083 RepID=UPI00069EFF68|nr:ATP-binding cassette domain-containing protein [Sandaracinus amylolyticus]
MIRAVDVHVAFRQPVLRGVSLEVPEGCIYALIGPGAAGKSVLLKTLAGLIRPSQGRVELLGRTLGELDEAGLMEVRRDVGMLFQNYALFDFMTVGENIAFPLRRLFSLGEREIQERVAERLARVSLPGFEPRLPAGLSGGQKKRVGVARATVSRPRVLLYDEPTAGLDPVTSQKIYDLIREEQRTHRTTNVVISSDVRGLLTIADRVGMLHGGKLIFEGTREQALASEVPEVRQFVHGLTDGPL